MPNQLFPSSTNDATASWSRDELQDLEMILRGVYRYVEGAVQILSMW